MFYYYGRKKQLAKHYPTPNYDCIIEPFAGSAAYSFYGSNWRKQIILIEKDEKVALIWDWLINEATPEQIKNMPNLLPGEKSSEFLHIIHAATKMAFKYKTIKVTPVLARNWEISKRLIAENLGKIKHWQLICGDYSLAPDIEATWFIDPPYKAEAGMGYAHSSAKIDYAQLATWCLGRRGEIICCEGTHGDYLPFEDLTQLKGVAGKSSSEKIFYRPSDLPFQKPLF
jgi:16S rRNA G966 N2-methylase RsmD